MDGLGRRRDPALRELNPDLQGNIWQCLEIFLIIMIWGGELPATRLLTIHRTAPIAKNYPVQSFSRAEIEKLP